ncbi:MAG TPA: hypothetical protein DHU96_25675 [Actinobacteria bacterium]|nr:hypothetical protein [Actinomycetota bacterium]
MGRAELFAAIFERYFSQIHQYLARRVGGKIADDLAAQMFVAAFAQRQRYDIARDSARPWLYRIATNLVGTHRRQERRLYRALARTDNRWVTSSDEDRVTDRVSAAAAGPALAAALAAPGRPVPLPAPPPTGFISGFALSPDGSKLAVPVLGAGNQDPAIQVFSLATGAERDWVWAWNGRTRPAPR